ncbi:serine/threonine protein kinase, putative [Ixodes scapularis]|uniref:Serine/threonine protein kinase, putative n=1 Tax=Ixodes scapularis TaxID=6945 RepID=B7QJM8_IXOSC|nr:serine/threonine protein kinase, putative [Ixodes scapularis]|eukprot:XP_002415385.1 serine/threonine protein kinase, putative [Ixodes scapularis]
MKGYFRRTPFEFRDGESAGTIPYMAPEILKRRPYGRACDWWSTGVVFYKLMTGRVPFRGKTKKMLRDRIIASPLKWPKVGEHPHSASSQAKDMVYLLLKKNPVERLGSKQYRDLRTHPFFDDFDWTRLHSTGNLCNIPAIYELMQASPPPDPTTNAAIGENSPFNLCTLVADIAFVFKAPAATTSTKKRKLLKMEELTDIDRSLHRPLFTYISMRYKRLVSMVMDNASEPLSVNESFMDTTNVSRRATEKLDLILFRKKSFGRYWGFGVNLESVVGEGGANFYIVSDMSAILRSCGRLTMSLSLVRSGCRKGAWYGFTTFEAKTWDQYEKGFSRLHIIQRAKDVRIRNREHHLFPGDILTHVDGEPSDRLSQAMLRQSMSRARPELLITIAPLSPLRKKRPSSTRLHETFLSDDSAGEPSSNAAIND